MLIAIAGALVVGLGATGPYATIGWGIVVVGLIGFLTLLAVLGRW